MSASENKAATQAAYQAFGAGDLEGATKDMADDIEWIEPGDSVIGGTYRGKDEVARLFMTLPASPSGLSRSTLSPRAIMSSY